MPCCKQDCKQRERAEEKADACLSERPDAGDGPFAHNRICAECRSGKYHQNESGHGISFLHIPWPEHEEYRNKANAEGDPLISVHLLRSEKVSNYHRKQRACAHERRCCRCIAAENPELIGEHTYRDAHDTYQKQPAEIFCVRPVSTVSGLDKSRRSQDDPSEKEPEKSQLERVHILSGELEGDLHCRESKRGKKDAGDNDFHISLIRTVHIKAPFRPLLCRTCLVDCNTKQQVNPVEAENHPLSPLSSFLWGNRELSSVFLSHTRDL